MNELLIGFLNENFGGVVSIIVITVWATRITMDVNILKKDVHTLKDDVRIMKSDIKDLQIRIENVENMLNLILNNMRIQHKADEA